MKVLALNGSPLKGKGNTNIILNEFLSGLQESGAEVEEIFIKKLKINPCLGKLVCWIKTPGVCCQKDDMADLLKKLADSDVWVFASPIYWDGVTGPMKNLMDRILPLLQPFIELEDDHCRHALRNGVKTGKVVLISTSGFWELDNFDPMVHHLQGLSKNIHREFSGALLRPHGAILKYMVKNNPTVLVQEVLSASRQAAVELVRDGKISKDTEASVSRELMNRDEYIRLINNNFERLLEKNIEK
jgi:multimeric flavodoxin WrbA